MNIPKMTLKEKVGALFTVSAFSHELDDSTRKLIAEWKIGGLFLGTNCLHTPPQVHALTSAAQKVSIEEGCGEPLFISADFVAGAGCKLNSGTVHFPKNRAIGAAGSAELAYESGRITAREALAMGVNFNYSPVLDINNNPLNPVIGTHSFGEERDEVIRLGSAVIRGYQENGMIATAKHFPGHGDTSVDSHEDLPVLPFDMERLRRFELAPFKQAVKEGVDAVMVGHMAVPEVDPSLTPASLSYELTTGILRGELGFEGLIVTDGLSMKGITQKYGMDEACVMAIQAGADILLATTDSYEAAVSMINAVMDAVKRGVISEERLDESLQRIQRVKKKYNLESASFHPPAYNPDHFLSEEGIRAAARLAELAVTPLNGLKAGILSAQDPAAAGIRIKLVAFDKCEAFTARLRRSLPDLELVVVKDAGEAIEALNAGGTHERMILASSGSKPLGEEVSSNLEQALTESGQDCVWIHFGSPYDVEARKVPCLMMYDFAAPLQEAAADYLLSRSL